MSKKIANFQPSIGLNNPIGRIVITFTDGSSFDANNLSPEHFSALMLALQASQDAYVRTHAPTGLVYLGTKPDAPGPG